MKHFTFSLLALFIFVSSAAFSQSKVQLGFQGGVNFGNSTTKPTSISTSARTGLAVGGVAEFALSDMLSIFGEVTYIQKGAEFEANTVGQEASLSANFDYIEIPILLKASFGKSEFKPFIFAGPNLGFNIVAEAEAEVGGESGTEDVKESTESIDFALDFGAGGEYYVNKKTAIFGTIRYSLGLTDIDKSGGDSSWKSNGVQLMAGVKFGL